MKQQSHFSSKALAAWCLVLIVLIQQVLVQLYMVFFFFFFSMQVDLLKLNELQVKFNQVDQFIHI